MLNIEMLNYAFQILIILGQRSRPRNGMRGPVPRNGVSTYLYVSNKKLKLLVYKKLSNRNDFSDEYTIEASLHQCQIHQRFSSKQQSILSWVYNILTRNDNRPYLSKFYVFKIRRLNCVSA